MDKGNIILDIQDLTKKVKGKTILHPLTYQLKRGKILAVCGGNGAGKSTFIRLISGLLKPTAGTIKLKPYDLSSKKELPKHHLGYMPDNFTFQPSLTAREVIQFYAQIKQVKKESYEKVLEEVGLLTKQHLRVGAFSKGMAQRLLLAQALLDEPSFLILDEPTNGLDPYWIDQFRQILLKAKENNQTVIFSTHDLYVAEHVADEVMFLHQGKVASQGPIESYQEQGLYEAFRDIYL